MMGMCASPGRLMLDAPAWRCRISLSLSLSRLGDLVEGPPRLGSERRSRRPRGLVFSRPRGVVLNARMCGCVWWCSRRAAAVEVRQAPAAGAWRVGACGCAGGPRVQVDEIQRSRLLVAAVAAVDELGYGRIHGGADSLRGRGCRGDVL